MTPRLVTSADVGRYLGRSASWFCRNRATLEARGFPRPVDACGMRWDRAAVDAWLDEQSRRPNSTRSVEDTLLERARKMMGGAPAA